MAEFTTFSNLDSWSQRSDALEARARQYAKSASGKTVFLSYSRVDAKYLPGVILILENHGGSVYVDKGDGRLPENVSPETARILRSEIAACKRLVVFVTTNSKDSRWIPWELGYGDGRKNDRNVALFPAAQNEWEQSWAGVEYLGLYRRIVWGQIQGHQPGWIVHDHHANTAELLREWLNVWGEY